MWGLIKLSRVYEAPLKYRMNLQNVPADKVLVNSSDTVITLYIKARGLELYSKMFNARKNKIDLNLSGIKMLKRGEDFIGIFKTSNFLKDIASQLPLDNNLLGVQPDTIFFFFQNEYQKRVPVEADLNLSFAAQFQLYDSITLSPDSITVFGIKSIVDTIYKVYTESKSLKGLNKNRVESLRILTPASVPRVVLSADTVTAQISVERFTEAKIEVPIIFDNPDISILTFPEKVTLTCRVAMREFDRLDPSLFSVSIDYQLAIASGSKLADVIVLRKPPFAKVIRIEPESIEYLLLK